MLQGWKYLISADDFAHVLTQSSPPMKVAALRYAGEMGSRTLLPVISAYIEDANTQVASEARRDADALNKNGR